MTVQRDDKGRFVKGSASLSPGRPKRTVETAYLDTLLGTVSEEYWQAICRRAVADAMKGDRFAREWLANYAIGKPPQIIELRGDELALLKQVNSILAERGVSLVDFLGSTLNLLTESTDDADSD